MALLAGTRLGPYEIVSSVEAGGMGEVYRARDTRLDRTVAVKVLPSHLSDNPEVRQRFDREARTADGQGFLIATALGDESTPPISLVQNWTVLLRPGK